MSKIYLYARNFYNKILEKYPNIPKDNFAIRTYRFLKRSTILASQACETIKLKDKISCDLLLFTAKFLFSNDLTDLYYVIEKHTKKKGRLVFNIASLPLMQNDIDKSSLAAHFFKYLSHRDPVWSKYQKGIVSFLRTEEGYEMGEVTFGQDEVLIDAGANFGIFAAEAASQGATVYAFEPIPEAYKYLEQTSKFNENIHPVTMALSTQKETLKFEYSPSQSLGSTSCVMTRNSNNYIEVEATSLDQWVQENKIEKIDFIKADIEGAERYMLEGASSVLKDMAPKLAICTYHLPDDKEVLTNIILKKNSNYIISYSQYKLFAYVPK
ncbi:FkbM family methyltransferase [Maridesulfovibrio sp.]|uniref:FkbM family methyltransferase n=1 Tax=Maridesulfovibrio sp. TaxID=2795000 RepID=UPI003BAB9C51